MAVVGSGTHLLLCAPFSMPLSALVRHDIYLIRTLVMIQTQIHSIFEVSGPSDSEVRGGCLHQRGNATPVPRYKSHKLFDPKP
jgi:hypothetical protein